MEAASKQDIAGRSKPLLKHAPKKKLGELLVEVGLLTIENLDVALVEQKKTGIRLGEILMRLQFLTEDQMAQALATQCGIRYFEPALIEIDPAVLSLIPETLARKHLTLPVEINNKRLTVAMVDPLDYASINDLRFHAGMVIEPVVATRYAIMEAIDRLYGRGTKSGKSIHPVAQTTDDEGALPVMMDTDLLNAETRSLEQRGKLAPAIQLTNHIFSQAVSLRASDVHVEPGQKDCRIRFRVDGLLKEIMKLPKWAQNPFISRIKILAKMDISERRLPQDGAMRLTLEGRDVDFRVSTLPTLHGEKVVIRILDQSKMLIGLDEVGLFGKDAETIRAMIKKKKGMILVTGPTGSGKTTTLYAVVNQLRAETSNLTTLEDPIEYTIDGINQVQINSDIGLSFAATLRSILRQDPNVIFVGEIRDLETAEIAFRAAMTGHLVLSTLHTNDAVATITRLVDIGVPRYIVASAVIGIVAQRLVRRLCPQCKVPTQMEKMGEASLAYSILEGAPLFHEKGCKACYQSGFSGRVGIFEILTLSTKLRKLISSGATELEFRSEAGGISSMEEDGLCKVKQGVTTVEEVLRVVEKEEVFKSCCPQCGHFMHADFLICPYCGSASPSVCSSCGRLLQSDWIVCPYCRHKGTRVAHPPLKTKARTVGPKKEQSKK